MPAGSFFIAILEGMPSMVNDTAIFNLRFGSNAGLHPSDEELRGFMESRKEGAKTLHRDDLTSYWDLLNALAQYKINGSASMGDKMLFLILGQSHFARPALKAVVEEFKYHVHGLGSLDFKKPAAFIKSAEAEMARLSPRKTDEAARLERMNRMVQERRQIIEEQKKRWLLLTGELSNILGYVTENLRRIEKLCEQSISLLVGEQVDGKKEQALIEDIKTEFKERLRDSLHQGTITKEQLEAAKEAVSGLSARTADVIRSDIYTMTQVYERIHEHVRGVLGELAAVAAGISAGSHSDFEADLALYRRAEAILITLVTGIRLEVKTADIEIASEADRMVVEKRKAMFEHLAGLLGA
jgi:hypothetical protein